MEEYITRAEFEQFKRHMEQKTDEMKAIRVDVHNVDVEAIKQELHTVSNTWLETLQQNYSEHKADFLQLRESQSDFRDRLIEHGTKLDRIEATQEQILKLLQQKDK